MHSQFSCMENLYQGQIKRSNKLTALLSKFKFNFRFNRFDNLRLNQSARYSPPKKRYLVALGVAVLFLAASFLVMRLYKGSASSVLGASDTRIELPGAKASITLNREFGFPLKDDTGKAVSNVMFVIETAELRDQIVVKGQKASSVAGRTFLILNLKLVNEFTKPVEIKTSDYIRLSVNGNEVEWLAPDMNNDPVAVQAISTKFTRVGFPINDSDKNLKLRIGEIEGEKQIVDLNF